MQALCANSKDLFESNTFKAQDICLDSEQNVCHFEIYPNENSETVIVCIGKGCTSMKTLCFYAQR